MSLLVRAFPLRSSPDDLRRFVAALQGERKDEARDFYAAHGVSHESWYLQDTSQGKLVIGLTQVADVALASPAFAGAQTDFALWFKQQIMELSGVDPSTTPEGPPTTLVYEWSDSPATRAHFAPPQR